MAEPRPPAPPVAGARTLWRRTAVKAVVGLVLALAFLHFFLRGTRLDDLWRVLIAADPGRFALACLFSALSLVTRGYRWRCYLRPVKNVSFLVAFEVLMIGYLFLNFVPGRVGDLIVRPLLIGQTERVPKVSVLATIAVERLFDTLTVVLFLSLYLSLLAPAQLGALELDSESTVLGLAVTPRSFGWLLLGGCLGGVAFLAVVRLHQERLLGLAERLARPGAGGLRARLLEHLRSFSIGLNLFHDGGNALRSVLWSLLSWLGIGLSLYFAGRAVELPIQPWDGGLLLGMGALGVAIPTPGGVGSFHYLMLTALTALGADPVPAQAGAILMWAASLVPITVLGLAAMLHRGVRLAEVAVEGQRP
jgi:hypothetical protein